MVEPNATWPRAILRALGVVYGPQLLGAVFSPLFECSHCVNTFFQLFVAIPGAFMTLVLPDHRSESLMLGGVFAVLLVAATTVLVRRWTGPRIAGAACIGLLTAVNSWALCHMLRA